MVDAIPISIASKPGCKKDGTILEGDFHVETIWTGFNERGLPEKMGGYQQLSDNLSNICRGLNIYSRNNFNYVHAGSSDNFERLTIQNDTGAVTGVIDRTPAGFDADDNNIWQIDAMFNANSSVTQVIAHATPSLLDISVETATPIYAGDITSTALLTQVSAPPSGNPTGGIVVLHPYLFYYGANGVVGWSVANTTDLNGAGSGAARVTESKVVKGLPLRGGPGNAPSGLFWALNELIRISFIGGSSVFQADTLSSTISILSPSAIIEDDGIYYWPGIDRFFVFNGVVRELINPYNRQFFFENLNYAYRTSVFATKVTSRGEIWFCFPFGSSTVCNHAVIYNKRLNCWYDTPLPNGGRSAGVWAQVYQYPLMTGAVPVADKSRLWQHEMMQYDEIVGSTNNAILAAYETGEKSFALPPEGAKPSDKAMSVVCVEPDFVQTGAMQMIVRGRPNCRAPDQSSPLYTFQATDATVDINATTGAATGEQNINPKDTRRLLRFRFQSNVAGGYFQAGTILASIQPSDGRKTS